MDGDLERVQALDSATPETPSTIAYTITRSHVHLSTVSSVYPAMQAGHIIDWQIYQGGPYLHNNRNRCVRGFLETGADVLLFVDSDMRATPQDFLTVIHSCRPDSPVIGAMYRNPGPIDETGEQPLNPVAYMWAEMEHEHGFVQLDPSLWFDADPDDNDAPQERKVPFLKVDGIGTGFMAIHRTLLERMATVYPEPCPWFDNVELGMPLLSAGEDLGFCYRVRFELDLPIVLCRAAKVRHQKELLI